MQQERQRYETWQMYAQMMLELISRKYKLEKWGGIFGLVPDRQAL
jgi:hypothetical protein